MEDLYITIEGPRNFINTLYNMDNNYPGIINDVFLDTANFSMENYFPLVTFFELLIAERRLKKAVNSFKHKVNGTSKRKGSYIDRIAKKLKIPIPDVMIPERDYFNAKTKVYNPYGWLRELRFEVNDKNKIKFNYFLPWFY